MVKFLKESLKGSFILYIIFDLKYNIDYTIIKGRR